MIENKRAGNTKVTSVSIPIELLPLIEKHNISPTLALKKGIGIELFMRGVPHYQSETNQERAEWLAEQEKQMKVVIDATKRHEKMKTHLEELEKIFSKLLFDIKFTMEKIKGGKIEDGN